MAKDKSTPQFELPSVWTVGSMVIVPLYDKRLNVRVAGEFQFVQLKSAAAEDWRKTLENKWNYNRPAYYEEVKKLWRWFRIIQDEINDKLLHTELHERKQ